MYPVVRMLRYSLTIGAMLAGLSVALAQSARIDRLDAIKVGILSIENSVTIKDASISTGQHTTTKVSKMIQMTNVIPAKDGTTFGVEFTLIGKPANGQSPIRIIWRYPQPGIKSPTTGTTKFTDEYTEMYTIGPGRTAYWTLGDAYTRVPGIWTVELWSGDRQLLAQDFTLKTP